MSKKESNSGNFNSYHRKLTNILLLIFAIVLPADFAFATVATEVEMEQVCKNWLTQLVMEKGNWGGSDSPEIESVHVIYSDEGMMLARQYSILPQGFIIIPVLKEMQPVKAYSDNSNLDERQSGGFLRLLKDILSERMNSYQDYWGSLDSPQSGQTDGIFGRAQKYLWDRYTQESDKFESQLSVEKNALEEAGPLLTSSWHQRAPYNNYCPEDGGGKTVVGCAATAMAQILYFWQWPANGFDSHEYYWSANACPEGGTPQYLSADFSDEYDWANMPDSCDEGCTPAQEDALAELCYEAGISLNMNYGSCGSGAWPSPYAYHHYFKYAPDIIFARRPDYDLDGWFSMIKNEINNGRPIQYGVAWHAIVCDGYRDHGSGIYEYHMNYGWHNEFNTWFVLDSLYCHWQPDSLCPAELDHLWANIRPQTEPIITINDFSIASDEDGDGHADVGETIELSVNIINNGWDVENLNGELTTDDSYITISAATSAFDSPIPWGGLSQNNSLYTIIVGPACPDPYVTLLELNLTGDGGYTTTDTILLFIGDTPGFADDIEGELEFWNSTVYTIGCSDEWHLETFRKHSGAQSWKVGGYGADNYSDMHDAGLITPPFLMPEAAMLSFWHWIDAEDLQPGAAFDGGMVMISTGNDNWTQIVPRDGYGYSTFSGEGVFPAETPCYSGYYDWRQAIFDLSEYSGVVRLMFRFGSDPMENKEGWYIDDVSVFETNVLQTLWDTVSTDCTALGIGSDGGLTYHNVPGTGGASMDYYGHGDCEGDERWYLVDGSPVIAYHNLETGITHTDNLCNESNDFLLFEGLGESDTVMSTDDYEVLESGIILTSDSTFAFEVTSWAPSGLDYCHFIVQRKKVFKYRDIPVESVRIGDAINWQIPSSASQNIGGVDAAYNLVYQQGQNEVGNPGCRDNERRFGGMSLLGYYYHDGETIYTNAYNGFVERRSVYVWPYHQFVPSELMVLMSQAGFRTTPFQEDIFSVLTYVADPVLEIGDTLYVYSVLISLLDGTLDDLRGNIDTARHWVGEHLGVFYSKGDANSDGSVNVGDVVYLVNYVFRGGPPPNPLNAGDANCDGAVNIGDGVYLINYIFHNGPEPC